MLAEEALSERLSRGPASSAELRGVLRASQPTVSRTLARLGARVARLGRARAARYALRRPIRELQSELPVFRVDATGGIRQIGGLAPIAPEGYWYEDEAGSGGLHASLPWFMADMRAQGFLGRRFAYAARERGLPERLSDWGEDQHLYALATLGEDAVGNLVIGEESHRRWQSLRHDPATPLAVRKRRTAFGACAAQVLAHGPPGSSAGGEQQKFTAALVDARGEVRRVIVKFSPPLREAAGRRWADLLLLEHLALRAIAGAGIEAARSEIVEDGERLYLQVTRFDRCGMHGRRGLVSLGALDDELVGRRRSWSDAAVALRELRWINPEDVDRAAWLEGFGRLIANSDMHFGNLSLIHEGDRLPALAPAYDMLPMAYAPAIELPALRPMTPPTLPPRALAQLASLLPAALSFWRSAASDPRISDAARGLAKANAAMIERAFGA